MESALRALLTGYAPLTTYVEDRVVWNHLPQSTTRPAIVLYRIAGAPGIHMQGSDGLTGAVVQIDIQATTVSEMWAIRSAVIALLHGYRDARLTGVFLTTERQSSEELAGLLIHRCSLDFEVWAPEA